MNIDCLNPFVRYAKTHYNIVPHSYRSICYDCRLFYIEQGNGYIEIENEKYEIVNGTAIYIPSGKCYKFNFENYSELVVLIFNFDLTNEFSALKEPMGAGKANKIDKAKTRNTGKMDMLDAPVVLHNYTHIYPNLLNCIEKFLTKERLYRESSSAILKLCLLDMIKKRTDFGTNRIVSNVLKYIYQHYSEPDLTNKSIAEHFSYHACYINTLFKTATGTTLHNNITKYRIIIAKNYLTTTDLDISEIAWRTGFNSSSYFIKAFRSNTGTTPKKYKDNHLIIVL